MTFLIAWPGTVSGREMQGREVMEKINRRWRGNSTRMLLEMTLRDSRKKVFHKSIILERKKFGAAYRSVYWVTAPDHEKKIALLLSEDRSAPAMWMYFPSNHQVTNVATRGFPAMASDFNCEDLLQQVPLDSYLFRIVGRDDQGKLIKVEMLPVSDRLKSELGFSRSIGWVRQDIGMIVRAEYYDEKGALFKKFLADDVRKVHGVWTAHRLFMENLRAQHSTEVLITVENYLPPLADSVFSPDALGSGFDLAAGAGAE